MQYRKLNLKTYEPKPRLEIDEGKTLSIFHFICSELVWFGGIILLIFAGVFMSSKGIMELKKKIRQFQIKREKVIDFRKDKPKGRIKLS